MFSRNKQEKNKEPLTSEDGFDENIELKEDKRDSKKSKSKKLEIIYPDLILLGFQEGTSLKDLKTYLESKASELGDLDLAYYNVLKKDGGFYWEIHDSGSGKGCLKSVVPLLDIEENVVIKTSRRWVRALRNKGGEGISSFLMNENESHKETEGVVFEDKMKSFSRKGNGFLYFSTVIAFLGLFSIFFAFIFKYQLLDQMKNNELKKVEAQIPYSQIDKMNGIIDKSKEGLFIKNLKWNKNSGSETNQYIIETSKEEVAPEVTEKEAQYTDSNSNLSELEELLGDENGN